MYLIVFFSLQGHPDRVHGEHLHLVLRLHHHLLCAWLHGPRQGGDRGPGGEGGPRAGLPRLPGGGPPAGPQLALVHPLLHHAIGPGLRLSVLHPGVSHLRPGGQLAQVPAPAPPPVHRLHGRLHVRAGHPADHQRRGVPLPAHGLLLRQRHVAPLVHLLPDHRHLLDLRS